MCIQVYVYIYLSVVGVGELWAVVGDGWWAVVGDGWWVVVGGGGWWWWRESEDGAGAGGGENHSVFAIPSVWFSDSVPFVSSELSVVLPISAAGIASWRDQEVLSCRNNTKGSYMSALWLLRQLNGAQQRHRSVTWPWQQQGRRL